MYAPAMILTDTDAPDVHALRRLLQAERPPMVLTGAGCSTESGIPAYRDRDGEWAHPRPIQFAQFRGSVEARRRYWARSFTGWPRFQAASPTRTHQALAWLEAQGWVGQVVTQNVDRLHSRAGAREVIDLHGRLDRVRCLDCGDVTSRADVQADLLALNPQWKDEQATPVAGTRPDGDRDVSAAAVARFRYVDCHRCGGMLKPDVVFFGENVPAQRLANARQRLDQAGGLLVVGSSLMVLSGYRFVREALAANKPVLVLTQGRTRADEDPITKVEHECGAALSALVGALGGGLLDSSPAVAGPGSGSC